MFGNKSELKKDGVTQNVRYYHGNYEKLETYTSGTLTGTKHIYYISGGNGLCAIATKEGSNPGVTYNYVYTDHLGSILKLTNHTGTVTAEQSFDAWGRLRNPNNWNDYSSTGTAQPIGSPLGAGGGSGWLTRGYTGHEHVPQVDLINMNGRMYDALLGRMLSPDRYVQDATSTQAYNRYSYVMNNPLKYTDPSGWIAYNKQREHAIEPDPNNYRSGTGGSVGNWGFYANGGASGYNYSGPYSLYASNPAQYASTYGSQTWMQQATTAAYEAQKNGIKYTVEIYDWYKKYSDGTMEYMDTQYKFEKTGQSVFVNESGGDDYVAMSGIANEINSMSYLLGTISSMYEGYLISNTKLLEKARKTAYAYRRPLSEAIEFNKAMIKGTSFVGEKLFGVGLVLSAIDVVDNNFSLNSISWAVADTYMGYLGTFVPGCQLISGIYFTGRIGYQIYKEIKKP